MYQPHELQVLEIVRMKYPTAQPHELLNRSFNNPSRFKKALYGIWYFLYLRIFVYSILKAIRASASLVFYPYVIVLTFKHPGLQFAVDGIDSEGNQKTFYYPPRVYVGLKQVEWIWSFNQWVSKTSKEITNGFLDLRFINKM